jgi:hypothetical protein
MPGGRPTKFTAEVRSKILEGIEKGHTLEFACTYAGVTYSAVRNWFSTGEEKYKRFAAQIEAVESKRDRLNREKAEREELERVRLLELGFRERTGKKSSGFVYLVYAEELNVYKIGRTLRKPSKRIADIRATLPFETELIHFLYSDEVFQAEAYFHRKFKEKQVRGEWFRLDKKDVIYVKSYDCYPKGGG